MNICLIGIDGTGKTTHSRNIQRYLEAKGRRVVYFHSGRFRYSLLIPAILFYNTVLGKDVICDRSYYDFVTELYPTVLIRYRKITSFLIYAILLILPKFDLTLFLIASFEEVSRRKNEVTTERYNSRMKLYEVIVRRLKIETINTERDFEEVEKQLFDCVVSRIMD